MVDYGHRCLIFGIGDIAGAIPLHHVSETMRCLPVEPLAEMPSFVRGVSVIRGTPTPVLNGPALLLCRDDIVAQRLIILKLGERFVALAVESIVGIHVISRDSQQALPPLLQNANAEIVSAIGLLDAKLLMILNAGCLVSDSIWKAVSARGVTP